MNYIDIIHEYLEFLDVTFGEGMNVRFSKHSIQELLRYSLCLNFGLPTNPSSVLARNYAKQCNKFIFGSKTHKELSLDEKQALIEACLIGLDKAIEKSKKGEKDVRLSI